MNLAGKNSILIDESGLDNNAISSSITSENPIWASGNEGLVFTGPQLLRLPVTINSPNADS